MDNDTGTAEFVEYPSICQALRADHTFLIENRLNRTDLLALATLCQVEEGYPLGLVWGMTGLARILGFATSSTSHIVEKLCFQGHVKKHPPRTPPIMDQRAIPLEVTDQGHRLLADYEQRVRAAWEL